MSFANENAKDRIRQSVDIVDLVGSYLPLRRQGRNFMGVCPFHDDSRPSLNVNPDRQSWRCWVCNIGGDIFSFVMKREGVGFREALQMLADRVGVTLESGGGPRTQPGDPNDKKTLYECLAWAERQFREYLLTSPDAAGARSYLENRRLAPETIAAFQLGYAPESWQWLLDRAKPKYSAAVLAAAGLANQNEKSGRHYDFFRGRVIFPIRDPQSRPIGFGARILPELESTSPAKYINTRETRLFSKSSHVYALDQAHDAIAAARNVVVVEGYMDVIMCHQHGLKNVVAVLGTALGPKHISLLRRYTDRITLVLDGDAAGQRRTNEVLDLFVASEVDLRIATLPDELDPCEFLEERPADDLRELLANAHDAFEHAITAQTQGVDLSRDTHRANQALEKLLAMIARAPRLTTDSSTAKVLRERQVIARLAREFGLDESLLRQRVAELRADGADLRPLSATSTIHGPATLGPSDPRRPDATLPSASSHETAPRVADSTGIGGYASESAPRGERGPGERGPGERGPGERGPGERGQGDSRPPAPAPISARSLQPLEAELYEILTRHPELADVALVELTLEHLSSDPARRLWAAYRSLLDRGESPVFLHVLDELEEPHWQSLLVELDERASSKEAHANADAATRLRHLIEDLQYRFQATDRRRQMATLEQRRLDEAEELNLLRQLLEQERRRQGIPAPTDG